ncbi:putative mitochondrial protein, partial [Mucuna pruriens]
MSVPNVYWGEAVLTAAYLINRLPTRVLNGISPIKHMLSFFPSSPLMLSLPSRVFGSVVFVHSHNPHRGKLDPKVVICVFIGYPSNKKGESYLEVEPVIESLPFPTQDVQVQVQVQEVTPTQDVQVQEVTKPTLVLEQVQMSELDEALKDENWVQVKKEEMETLEKNSTWEIVDRPKDKRVVGCRWIYTVKCKSDGTLEKYKTRLVAKGYTQTYGIDYEETFIHVAKINTPPTLAETCNNLILKMSSFMET